VCTPSVGADCCTASTYDALDGDILIGEADFLVTATTARATAAFADKNGDGCKRAGSGFTSVAPNGPVSLTGAAAAGPCCQVGQAATIVASGVALVGGAPLYDLGFTWRIPITVASCNAYPADPGSCVLTSDPCLH
jgi:hypothetical protein